MGLERVAGEVFPKEVTFRLSSGPAMEASGKELPMQMPCKCPEAGGHGTASGAGAEWRWGWVGGESEEQSGSEDTQPVGYGRKLGFYSSVH